MRRGKPPLKRTQEGLHFIISNPSSNDGKAKDLHVVRSHVGRWTWQKVRKQQEEIQARTENKEVNSVPVAGSDTSEDEDENLESEFSALGSVSSSSSSSSTSYIVHNDGDDEVGQTVRLKPMSNFKPDRSSQEHSNLPSPSPIRSICASILDPFQTHVSSPISTDLVSMSNKYSITVLWPGLMPSSWTGATHAGIQDWFSSSTMHTALHSAMLFGSYSHRRTRWLMKGQGYFSAEDMRQMTVCEAEVIAQITAILPNTDQAVCDAVILSVLCMATNRYAGGPKCHQDMESPFQAPLRSLQWLDVYGRLSPNPLHQAGLSQLVYLRGGLEKIELPGLAAVISFSSILGASKSLSRPHLPFISLQTGRPMALQDVFQNDPPPSESDPLLAICITNEMYHIFCGVRTYLSLVENFQDGVQGVDHQTLCDARNLLQWHIMSLLPESQLGPVLLQLCPVYEACRLALMIFGVGIIFPLPADIAPLGHAARSMQLGLQMHSSHHVGLESEALIQAQCWCLVLGGIAAGPQEREWFVHELRHMLPMLGVTIWTELKMVLKLFLWWDLACDSAGRQLWDEVSLPC